MAAQDSDDRLLVRLRRAIAAAGRATGADDRRRLLILVDEVETLRARIAERCEAVANEMKAARAQIGAIAAYARCAKLTRGAAPIRTGEKMRN